MLFFVVALCMAVMTSAAADQAKDAAAVQVGGGAGLRGAAVVDGSVQHRGLQISMTMCRYICIGYKKGHCTYASCSVYGF
jgi:hypothetical protein